MLQSTSLLQLHTLNTGVPHIMTLRMFLENKLQRDFRSEYQYKNQLKIEQ